MNRTLLAVLLPLLTINTSDLWAEDTQGRPNVLFIAIDDLNDYISPLDNQSGVKTPNFDRLARRSVTFANAHCAAPACHPSRVAVMTGVHPVTSGLYNNLFGAHGPRWRDESPVLKDAVVLSQHFRNHGYYAVGGGKLFHTLQWTPGDSQNDPEAWDEYRGDPLDPISKDWPRPELIPDAQLGLTPGRPLSHQLFGAAPLQVPDEQTGDHMVVDWALKQLQQSRDKPLFLALGLFRPHIPFEVPQKYFDRHPLKETELPAHRADDLEDARVPERQSWHTWVVKNQMWEKLMQGYLASVSYTDQQLGRLLDGLDASPLKDNTIVVLWSDHGFHVGEKENWEKFNLWDQTTHVPLFIHVPGRSADGQSTRAPVTLTDIYPTLCELADLPIPPQCDGTSLMPQIMDPTEKHDRVSLTSYCFKGSDTSSHAVSDERYRFIRYDDGFEELYDLQSDRHEFTNLAGDPKYSEVKQRLARGIPNETAPRRRVPTDSKYHRPRRNNQKQPPAKASR